MIRKSKFTNIIGSFIIGIVSLLVAYFGFVETGILQTGKTELVILSQDASKIYDGEELTCEEYSIVAGELKQGHELVVEFTAKLETPGTINNTYTVKVLNKNGEEVKNVYDIELQYGKLEVLKRPLVLESNSLTKEYDGLVFDKLSVNSIGEYELLDSHSIEYTFKSTILTVGVADNAFDVKILDGTNSVTDYYDITKTYGKLEITKRDLKIQTESSYKEYDGSLLENHNYKVVGGSVAKNETLEVIVYSSLINVGKADNLAYARVYDSNNINVVNNYNITYEVGTLEIGKRSIKVQSLDENKVYDGTDLTGTNYKIITGSLVEGHKSNVVSSTSIKTVGKKENKLQITIVDGEGKDVLNNYSVSYVYGTLEIKTRDIEIKTASETKEYDGVLLEKKECEISSQLKLVEGHTLSCVMNSTITGVGKTNNNITEVKVLDADENDVTSNYKFTYVYGVLEITSRSITIQTGSAKKDYDGEELSSTEYEIISGSIADDQEISILSTTVISNAEKKDNKIQLVILDLNSKDVTSNYSITYVYGLLEVTPIALTIQTPSLEKEYDGTPLEGTKYEVIEGSLLENHEIVILSHESITDVDEIGNELVVSIQDEDGNILTSNYKIAYDYGMLKVTARKITIKTGSASKDYDERELRCEELEIVDGELVVGHELIVLSSVSFIDAGDYENEILFDIQIDGVSKMDNYEVEFVYGTLVIKPLPIFVKTESKSKVYDGTALTHHVYEITNQESLIKGHKISFSMNATITDVGSEPNGISNIVVKNAKGQIITNNYEFIVDEGTLTVLPREITIATGSARKEYDGTALTCEEYEIKSKTTFLEIHDYEVIIGGFQIVVGESDNFIAEVIIIDKETQEDVSFNYEIREVPGTLEVYEVTQTPGGSGGGADGGSGEGEGNGDGSGGGDKNSGTSGLDSSGDLSNSPFEMDDTVIGFVTSSVGGTVYLKFRSYGDYTYGGFEPKPVAFDSTTRDFNPQLLTSYAIAENRLESGNLTVELLATTDFLYPYYVYGIDDYLVDDFSYSINHDGKYTITYFDKVKNSYRHSTYRSYEQEYAAFVEQTYLQIPNATKASMLNIFKKTGIDVNDPNLINEVAEYIQCAATYNLKFTPFPEGVDMAVYFLETAKEGICQHYAAAATMMYRALGVPARYTGGYVANTEAGKRTEFTAKQAHAWVEVYINGLGWINVEVTGSDYSGNGVGEGSGGSGNDDIKDMDELDHDFAIKPADKYMKYDGISTLKATNEIQGLTKFIAAGYTYEAVVSGEQKSVGYGVSTIESFVLYDPEGNDVTDQFEITFRPGILHVYVSELKVSTGSAQKVYDGTPLVCEDIEIEGFLQTGHYYKSIIFEQKMVNVGYVQNNVRFIIYNENDEDVTNMYYINKTLGTLEIKERVITITVNSGTKVYDGTPLISPGYKIAAEGLDKPIADGEVLEIEISGSQTNIGKSENKVKTIKITRGEEDVTNNYSIIIENGILFVKPF